MIFWDITKTVKAKAYSGLTRVSRRLLEALNAEGVQVQSCRWSGKRGQPMAADGSVPGKGDCWITPELFSEEENPGLERWLGETAATTLALYHDAIPLRHPEFTWPKSVARHPFYMKLLACCDGVLANSEASRSELLAYWEWAGIGRMPPVEAIPLGADFSGDSRVVAASPELCRPVRLLMTGILEPRKNHALVLDACALLSKWNVPWELDLVGRVNPHFGKPILQRIKSSIRDGAPLRYHGQVSDLALRALYRETHLTLFPSLAEGNGLPVIESM
ncbi:MAG TPA: glycosyltransferase, partial [Opitutales bacterium]|nr:glycosyltransferase [Opitutales bacterium]